MTARNFNSRNCIFCGEKPKKGNKEHFIARWLSRFAGNDDVPASIADADGTIVRRRWSSLKLPACEGCNSEFGEFEERAKPTFERLSAGRIHSHDVPVILDYMDKLRVSIWLWRLYWCKKNHRISPNFHVKDRIGTSDRVVFACMYPKHDALGIAPLGYDNRSFIRSSSVLGILIKNFILISISRPAFLTDHFQMTAPVQDTRVLPIGRMARIITTVFKYNEISNLLRIGGTVFFSFGRNDIMNLPTQHYFTEEDGKARPIRCCETFEIAKTTQSRLIFRTLAQLNIHEIQYNMLSEIHKMNAPNSEQITTKICRDELQGLIRGDHLILDATSPFKYPRRSAFYEV